MTRAHVSGSAAPVPLRNPLVNGFAQTVGDDRFHSFDSVPGTEDASALTVGPAAASSRKGEDRYSVNIHAGGQRCIWALHR